VTIPTKIKGEKVMKNSAGFIFLVTVLLTVSLGCGMLSTPVPPTFTAEPAATATLLPEDISGVYILEGTNPDGSTYTGEVEISGSNNSYVIVWKIGDQQSQTGQGTFDGTKLTARWQEGESSGDVVYTLQSDGSLSGIWTIDGGSDQGSELLILK
jgi:hypothetical protein